MEETFGQALEAASAGLVAGQEACGQEEPFLFAVAAPGEGAEEAAGRSAERPAPGLQDVVAAEVGQVAGGLPVFVFGREVPGDDLGDGVLVEEDRGLFGAESDGIGPLEIEIGDVGNEHEVAQVLHPEEGPEYVLPQLAFLEPQSVAHDEVAAGQLVPGRVDEQPPAV